MSNNNHNINNDLLYQYKYDIDIIEKYIDFLDMRKVLLTQKLDIDFIINNIFNNDSINDEPYVNINFICRCQSHINEIDLKNAINNY
jgi:hypothetical protein